MYRAEKRNFHIFAVHENFYFYSCTFSDLMNWKEAVKILQYFFATFLYYFIGDKQDIKSKELRYEARTPLMDMWQGRCREVNFFGDSWSAKKQKLSFVFSLEV